MIFIKRGAGETVVLRTPEGEIVIQVLGSNELGIEMPAGVTVAPATKQEKARNWLPARPKSPAV